MGDGWNPETLVVKTTARTNNNANAKLALITVVSCYSLDVVLRVCDSQHRRTTTTTTYQTMMEVTSLAYVWTYMIH
jgi:hypothetical protein